MRIGTGGKLTVTATERWLSEIQAGRAFCLGSSAGPSAGNYSHLQLINPVGSTITVVVRSVVCSQGTAGDFQIKTHNAALSGDLGPGVNMLFGGTAGQAHVYNQNSAAAQGTLLYQMLLGANTPLYISPEWFFLLPAGKSIIVHPGTVNVSIEAGFCWIEY